MWKMEMQSKLCDEGRNMKKLQGIAENEEFKADTKDVRVHVKLTSPLALLSHLFFRASVGFGSLVQQYKGLKLSKHFCPSWWQTETWGQDVKEILSMNVLIGRTFYSDKLNLKN